jgi:hypothetical protein
MIPTDMDGDMNDGRLVHCLRHLDYLDSRCKLSCLYQTVLMFFCAVHSFKKWFSDSRILL